MNAHLPPALDLPCPQCGMQNRLHLATRTTSAGADGQATASVGYAGACATCHAQLVVTLSAQAPTAGELLAQAKSTLGRLRGAGL